MAAESTPLQSTAKSVDAKGVAVDEKDADALSLESGGVQLEERDFKKKQVFRGWLLFWLAYQSTGVIYGDIGTSPLYVYSSTFSSPPSADDLLGALSLIIWSLTLIVTVKYVFIVLCADDEGEGGTFAIYSLLSRHCHIASTDPKRVNTIKLERCETSEMKPVNRGIRTWIENSKVAHAGLKILAVFGVSLIMADAILTPAQSVLGAIQGLNVVQPNISTNTIVGASCGILVALFIFQPLGVSKLGSCFAPVVIIWLSFNFAFGVYNLAVHDWTVLKAFSPYFAGAFFVRNKTNGWLSLGGILLAFTGVEALFADLGAFSKRAIQLSWLCFVYPCLLLAYIGQAAYIMDDRQAYSNPFFKTVPPGMFWPSMIVSILAAIVASQAIITSTFQLLSQIINMSYFPQIKMVYTSTNFHGQVYVPMANWLLMIGTVIVTAVYSNTTRLGHAYGVCVILVTFITTCLVTLVALVVWRRPFLLVFAVALPFLTLDGMFLSSALTKVPNGAWFTLLLAVLLASFFTLWRFGKEQQWKSERQSRPRMTRFALQKLNENPFTGIDGIGIFFDKSGTAVPTAYAHFLQKFRARPDVLVFLHIRALSVPTVAEAEKYTVTAVAGIGNCYRVVARHGYNDQIVTEELSNVVYSHVRRFIVRSSKLFVHPRPDAGSSEQTSADVGQGKWEPFDDTSLPVAILSTATSQEDEARDNRDDVLAGLIAKLDKAYAEQVVYLVGKSQLRIVGGPEPGASAWTTVKSLQEPRAGLRRVLLAAFLWVRDNTRQKVASMRIPVEKLVEVGFLEEI